MWRTIAANLSTFWATRAASTWLLIGGIAVTSAGVIYVQNLRTKVANCKADREIAELLRDAARPAIKQREQERDEAISELDKSTHVCLDVPLADLLRDEVPAPD